jgi:branched-chain amino acid transport system permease protein
MIDESLSRTHIRIPRAGMVGYGALLLVTGLLPVFVHNLFILRLMCQVMIYVLLTIGQNIITGYTGMLSMGQAAFYGIGAYVSALLMLRFGAPWPVAFLGAGLISCALGLVLGLPCVRVGSDYLTLMTVASGTVFYLVFVNWMPVTGGPLGLRGVPPPQIGSLTIDTPAGYYYLFLVITGICYVLVYQMINSKVGRALVAIREDEIAASAMGINLAYYKLVAFGVGALLAGLAGSLLAHFILFVGPSSFTVDESILHMQMAILGGLGSLPGSILGAAVLTIIPQILQAWYEYRILINGLLMVGLMIWRPQGLLGTIGGGKSLQASTIALFAPLLGKLKRT